MKWQILIIEDEKRIANWVKVYLEDAGFNAETAYDGITGLELARKLKPDLILLDLMLPTLDGMEICRILRSETDTPIIMLTAKETHADRISGLDIGADDYITKPFDPAEVVARVKSVLRRTKHEVQQVLVSGTITLDETTQTVTMDQHPIKLSQTQFALLAVFMRHPNQVLSREQLIDLALGSHFEGFDRSIDNHITRLRKKIKSDKGQPIETVYGSGYKFVS